MALGGATGTTYDPVLKELYPQRVIDNMVYAGAPLLAMLPKSEEFYGDQLILAAQHGNPQGRSATFLNAQANASPSTLKKFVLTRVSDYAVATLTTELIESSANNKGAIVAALKNEVDSALMQLGRSWHHACYNVAGGAIGQVGAFTTSATTFTLANIEDVANWEIDQTIVANNTNDGVSVRAGTVLVTAVNRDTGVITGDTQWDLPDGITGFAVNDFVFVQGDPGNKVSGLLGWLPTTAPTGGDSFFGVDRSVDPTRLAGVRFDGSALSIEEALIQGASRIARQGKLARPDYCFMHTVDFGNLIVALGSKKEYHTERIGDIGFDGVLLHTPAGTIKVFPDFQCPNGTAFMLTMRTWKWWGLKKSPRLITVDGLRLLRQSAADGVEFRAVYRGQLGCTAPGFSGQITLPA